MVVKLVVVKDEKLVEEKESYSVDWMADFWVDNWVDLTVD
jgi:hypothetical protein